MDRNIKSLTGYRLTTADGEIGEVKDFYFDDETWKIRYLVISTGGWLSEKEVLITPTAIENTDWLNRVFQVNLTKAQISSSPDIDTDKPVYRQQEIGLYDHYAWEAYWLSGFYPGGYLGVAVPFPSIDTRELVPPVIEEKTSTDDVHLRSADQVTGYHVHATDGEIGHVYDFVIDDQTWQVLSLVIDTNNWLGGKKVVIPISHILKVEWDNSKVYVDLIMSAVKDSPLFEETTFDPPENRSEIKVDLPVIPLEVH
jgi:sporulation protein YlmC with PRC-barrel domain